MPLAPASTSRIIEVAHFSPGAFLVVKLNASVSYPLPLTPHPLPPALRLIHVGT